MDQIVNANISFLVPLNQSAGQLMHVLFIHVTCEDRQKRQRKIHDDRNDASQLVSSDDSFAGVLVQARSPLRYGTLIGHGLAAFSLSDALLFIGADSQWLWLQKPLAREQLADRFGFDVCSTLTESDQSNHCGN